jgi:hypothetical protein
VNKDSKISSNLDWILRGTISPQPTSTRVVKIFANVGNFQSQDFHISDWNGDNTINHSFLVVQATKRKKLDFDIDIYASKRSGFAACKLRFL